MNICAGHAIHTATDCYLVRGNMKLRGRYLYVCTDKTGRKVTLERGDVLDAIKEGNAKVVA